MGRIVASDGGARAGQPEISRRRDRAVKPEAKLKIRLRPVHADLQEAVEFHHAIIAEGSKALVGYDTAKALANVVLLSEIPTTYDKREQRQVNAGNLLLRGVPGVGKTFFGVILAAISDAKFARIQGRADLQPTEVVGFQMINPSTGALVTEFGPLASAEVILLDEINRIPLKSQSAFLEGLQDRPVTVGKETYELPAFSFAIATMNPVELGQGTFPLSEAATDRFAIMINIGYLPPGEEQKLVNFDFKRVKLNKLLSKERIIELRARITEQVFLHERLGKYIQQLVAATRPYNPDTDWLVRSPSELVERGVDLGASPRAIICWGRLAKVWALLQRNRTEVYPEDIQDLAPHILSHRIWLGPHAASHGLTPEAVIKDIIERVPCHEDAGPRGGRAARQHGGHHRDRAGDPQTHARGHDRRSSQPLARHGVRLHRAARLAGRRPLLVDRLGAVVPHQLLAAGRPRVRTAEHRDGRRHRRRLALDALRHPAACRLPPRSPAPSPRSACRRSSFRIRSGWSRSTAGSCISAALRPTTGKSHIVHCLDAYQHDRGLQSVRRSGSISTSLGGFVRRQSMLPIISDFLFDDVRRGGEGTVAAERAARCLPRADRQRVRVRSAEDLRRVDRNRGRRNRARPHHLAPHLRRARRAGGRWQDDVRGAAKELDLDVVTIGVDQTISDIALSEFVVERRLRKTKA